MLIIFLNAYVGTLAPKPGSLLYPHWVIDVPPSPRMYPGYTVGVLSNLPKPSIKLVSFE